MARTALGLAATTRREAGGFIIEVTPLTNPEGVRVILESGKAFIRLGLKPEDIVKWSRVEVDSNVAIAMRAALKGRYGPSAWRRVAKPIFDELRKKQRDALVAAVTNLPGAPYGETPERVFEHLLLDPGTEPPVLASRIQLAISSVQLFIQRCLMTLEEPDVPASIIDAPRWEWMSRYRIWEVNRKIYCWPENWLEPEFRDDKTHLFQELEAACLSGDISEDLVRKAFYTYLQGLQSIARLEMMTMYFEPGLSAGGSIVHVIGRTPNAPNKYFYRKCSHGMWSAVAPARPRD